MILDEKYEIIRKKLKLDNVNKTGQVSGPQFSKLFLISFESKKKIHR